MRVTIMFLLHLFVNKEKFHQFWLMQFSVWCRLNCNIFSLDFCKTYAIFLHCDRQLSWQFHTFERNMQFWHTMIGNFYDKFIFLNEWCHFYTEIGKFTDDFMSWGRYVIFIRWIFCIFWVPYDQKKKKMDGTYKLFLSDGYFAFSGYPMRKKWTVPFDTARFPSFPGRKQ